MAEQGVERTLLASIERVSVYMEAMRLKVRVGAMAISLSVLWASSARAEPSAADRAAAEALFAEGRKLLAEGDALAACPKFAESKRLDPGIGTMLNLADCYERIGKTASAWGMFNEAEDAARRAHDTLGRDEEAHRRAQQLEPRLSRLIIAVSRENRTSSLEVLRDGQPVGEGMWGTAIPVDPGEHTIEARAPGKEPWTGRARVEASPGTMTVSVPALGAAKLSGGGAVPGEEKGGGAQRTAGIALGGIGVAGVVIGSVFGGLVVAKKGDLKDHCLPADPRKCDADGVAIWRDANTKANVANVAFGVGGAALIAGAVLFFTAPRMDAGKPGSARIGLVPGVAAEARGVWLRGEW